MTARTLHLLFLGSLAIVLPLSGCNTPVGDELTQRAAYVGDSAMYASAGGARLSVTIVGPALELDPWANRVPVVLLRFEFTPQPAWKPFTFFEAVDGEGRIVAQRAQCVAPLAPGSNYDGIKGPGCALNRTALYFGAWGWPGALGAASMWFGDDGDQLVLPGRKGDPQVVPRMFRPADAAGCTEVSHAAAAQVADAVPLVLGAGQAVFCDGQPFPAAFQSSRPWSRYTLGDDSSPRFVLQTLQRGELQVERPRASPPARPSLELQDTGRPYLQNEPDSLPFGTWEAIGHAANESATVARFLETHREAVPVASTYRTRGGSYDALSGTSVRDERRIWLASKSGSCIAFSVERNQETSGLLPAENAVDYEVKLGPPFPDCPDVGFDASAMASEQMTYENAAKRSRELTGLPEAISDVGYSHIDAGNGWTDPSGYRSDGYALLAEGQDPYPRTVEGPTGAMTVSNHYDAVFHGPSGTLLYLMIPPDHPTLGGQ